MNNRGHPFVLIEKLSISNEHSLLYQCDPNSKLIQ